mgnify:FL=1
MSIFSKLFSGEERRITRGLTEKAEEINKWEPKISALSDQELKEQTKKFKERLCIGDTLDVLLSEAFATVRVAAK